MSSSKDKALIELISVSKKYENQKVLDNVSFRIEKGCIFGYIGPNGAGKTTTMKIIVGLVQDYEGKILFRGKDAFKDRLNLHKSLGYIPQEAGFQQWRTIDHALKTFGQLSGIDSDRLEIRIQEVLKQVGLSEVRHTKIKYLSGGMIQKLRLVQALLHEPELLILDEPLSGLDPSTRYQVKNIIKTLSQKGTTIFISSHILSDIQDIADEIGILNLGQLVKVGTPAELQKEFQIGNIIQIEVADSSPLCDGLESLPNVKNVDIINSTMQRVLLKSDIDIDEAITDILGKITSQKCQLRGFLLVKPSLEDVYLKYVGGAPS
ncbi:MAG: ATP-binding cassette domain-containing protein [Promethearchaeota archaeon]